MTKLITMAIAPTHEAAVESMVAFAAMHGWPKEVVELVKPQIIHGDPDSVAEQVQAMIDAGLDGLTPNLATLGHDIDAIALAAATLSPFVP